MKVQIHHAIDAKAIAAVRNLLWEYGRLRNFDAALGDYEQELAQLPGKYAPPRGCLLLAQVGTTAVGCVAFQALETGICEMKRMFVLPDYQHQGIGSLLIGELVGQAKAAGYERMRLDTHPSMEAAARLYQKLGFGEIERYNENPTPGIRFFERVL